jgi:hypothetical protein
MAAIISSKMARCSATSPPRSSGVSHQVVKGVALCWLAVVSLDFAG